MRTPPLFRSLVLRGGALVAALMLWAMPGVALAASATLQNLSLVCPSGSQYHLILTNSQTVPSKSQVASALGIPQSRVVSITRSGGSGNGAIHMIVNSTGAALPAGTLTNLTPNNPQASTIWTISSCENVPPIPEVPMAALFPAIGGLTFAAGYGLRRLRRRRGSSEPAL